MKEAAKSIGQRGEDMAAEYLMQSGHIIVARNWRWSHLELDIISQDSTGLHFVEVKSRRKSDTDPIENFTKKKQASITKAVNAFLNSSSRKNLIADLEVFFDLITIVFDEDRAVVQYFPQVFIPIYT